jgi:hypothetical protein
MPQSFDAGDYRMLAVFESSSRADSWYRLLIHNTTHALSCDCPPWIFNPERVCAHTEVGEWLLGRTPAPHVQGRRVYLDDGALVGAMDSFWHGGLQGEWSFEGRDVDMNRKPYRFVLSSLALGSGDTASVLMGFARAHLDEERMQARLAGWAGYGIASEIARLGGFPTAGQQPEHFKVPKPSTKRRTGPSAPTGPAPYGLRNLLQMADETNLGDGLRPRERAENTLKFFLGDGLYRQLEQRHFLDVSSYLYPQRVYRLRRDPEKSRDRRVRVFEHGRYWKDFCIVRADRQIPEADFYLGQFLGFMSDEQRMLNVVDPNCNIFGPHSDDYYQHEEETIPVVWVPRAVQGRQA